jgi:hypothetical protein
MLAFIVTSIGNWSLAVVYRFLSIGSIGIPIELPFKIIWKHSMPENLQ